MTDMLAEMLRMQDELERLTTGYLFSALANENLSGLTPEESRHERIQQFKEMFEAGIREAVEQMDEIGSKPWATSKHWNTAAVKKEIVDEWHFLLAKALLAGFTAEELYEAYKAKWEVNAARQTEGYDGVTTKCPICKRALDDETTKCYIYPGGVVCMDMSEEVKTGGDQ